MDDRPESAEVPSDFTASVEAPVSVALAVELLADMPKTELHLHLDGSIRPATAVELAASRGVDAPREVGAMRDALVAPAHSASQAELLRAFDLPIELLQDGEALDRVTRELIEDKAAENVRYVEIRWGPLLHVRRGLGLGDGIAAVCTAAREAGQAAGIEVRLICTALRSHDPADNEVLAETAAGYIGEGLTGFDLAGLEEAYPDPLAHRRAFEAARSGGLRITLHAGEWGGATQVRRALALAPERIAHGPLAIDDRALCEELRARSVSLDLCPTSNVQAGIVPAVADHPLARLHRAGVPVTLSTDDRTVSDVTLTEEYRRAVAEIGLSPAELWAIDRHGLSVAFADTATLGRLVALFDRWEADHPEVLADDRRPDRPTASS